MYKVADFYKAVDTIAPFSTAEDWDNVGLLVGSGDMDANRALLALDVTSAVLEEAKALGVKLIITHHPVIFSSLTRLSAESMPYRLAAAGISVISAHTNLDLAEGGVNDALAEVLGLENIRPLSALPDVPGRVGDLKKALTAGELADYVSERLGTVLRYVANGRIVKTVAVCGGSGGEYLRYAIEAGADAFITGEARHHELLEAGEAGLTLIEAGHFKTENVVIPVLARRLKALLPSAEILISEKCADKIEFTIKD